LEGHELSTKLGEILSFDYFLLPKENGKD